MTKAAGEAMVQHFAERHDLSSVCLRLGSCHEGEATPASIDFQRQEKWLSARDFCHGVERSIEAELPNFSIFNLTSEIEGSRWDISTTKSALDYAPRDRHQPRQRPFAARLRSYLSRQLKRV